jgi:hypothetical protein
MLEKYFKDKQNTPHIKEFELLHTLHPGTCNNIEKRVKNFASESFIIFQYLIL